MMNIRLPNITAQTERGQLEQIRSYLYQFAQELNWAMDNIDKKAEQAVGTVKASVSKKNEAEKAQATFAEIKSLIIKSADIVNAYYEEINHRLEGSYVAVSDFGTYQQETAATLRANSESMALLFENQQSITTDMGAMSDELDGVAGDVDSINGVLQTDASGTTIIGSQAWCKIGVVSEDANGFPIYGMEIGQVNTQNGETTMKKYAQYRSDGVHLFDQNGIEVATISDYKLSITNAEIIDAKITGSLKLGGYAVSTGNGLTFKWEGR